jgi:hypothetical protein
VAAQFAHFVEEGREEATDNGGGHEGGHEGMRIKRTVATIAVIGILAVPTHVEAQTTTSQAPANHSGRSTAKKVMWISIGATAGFFTGVLLGLEWFDDALYSDRKVWTTAIVGGIAGGVTAGLIARDNARPQSKARPPMSAPWTRPRREDLKIDWRQRDGDRLLRARVRILNLQEFSRPPG